LKTEKNLQPHQTRPPLQRSKRGCHEPARHHSGLPSRFCCSAGDRFGPSARCSPSQGHHQERWSAEPVRHRSVAVAGRHGSLRDHLIASRPQSCRPSLTIPNGRPTATIAGVGSSPEDRCAGRRRHHRRNRMRALNDSGTEPDSGSPLGLLPPAQPPDKPVTGQSPKTPARPVETSMPTALEACDQPLQPWLRALLRALGSWPV